MNEVSQLYGLVLAGGMSRRMGKDKGQLRYHGISQQEHTFDLLEVFCEKVFISVRKEQVNDKAKAKYIFDKNVAKGPLNGMLSAHLTYPKMAWLVLACDAPLVDIEIVKTLISSRDTSKMATVMATRKTGEPEPLIAIWEPQGLAKILEYSKTTDKVYPTKFLLNHPIQKVYPDRDVKLANVNTPEDFERITNLFKTEAI